MSSTIKLNTELLKSQADELNSLCEEYEDLFVNITDEFTKASSYLSTNIANRFIKQVSSAKKALSKMTETLSICSNAANSAAEAYETADETNSLNNMLNTALVNEEELKMEDSLTGLLALLGRDKIEEFLDLINGDYDSGTRISKTISWIKSITKVLTEPNKYVKDIVQSTGDLGFKGFIPSEIKETFDFLSDIDTGVDITLGVRDYINGFVDGDMTVSAEGASGIIGGLLDIISGEVGVGAIGKYGTKAVFSMSKVASFGVKTVTDYSKNMVSNWMESIAKETSTSEVYWNTFANSAVETFTSTVCNPTMLTAAYLPARIISDGIGYDLQGAYDSLSDKKGLGAVFDTFEQAADLFKENSTWENWKSGMGVIVDDLFKKGK